MGRVEFKAGKDQVRTWIRLKEAFIKLRGFDLEGSKKGPRVPRTTNSDIEALVARWSEEIAMSGGRALGEGKGGQSKALPKLKKIIGKWRRTADGFLAIAKRNPDDAVFPENARFWRATRKLAIDLSSIKAFSGAPWSLTVSDIGEAVADAPRVIAKAVTSAARKTGEAAGSVVGGFLSGAGVPLLVLLGVGVYAATRKRSK